MKEFNLNIEIPSSFLNCEYCSMCDNCTQSYKECRTYNKELWNLVDNKITDFRNDIFNSIIKTY